MATTIIEFTKLPGCDDIAAPQYMSEHSSGMDVRAAVTAPVIIDPGDVVGIPTGLKLAIPPGFEVQVRPRSGLALKNGITIVNAPGTIDADYRGEVCIILGNIGKQRFTVSRGMRIAQLVVQEVVQAEMVERTELSGTVRADGGMGHTGTF